MRKFILIFALALPCLTWADQPVQKGDRIDDATIINQTPAVRSSQAIEDEIVDEQIVTVLEPEFQQLEDRYRLLLDDLQSQMSVAQPDQQEVLELHAIALKQQLHEERLEVVLSYVQAQGNKDAEARVLKAIENYRNAAPVLRVRVARDPITGEARNGGAK